MMMWCSFQCDYCTSINRNMINDVIDIQSWYCVQSWDYKRRVFHIHLTGSCVGRQSAGCLVSGRLRLLLLLSTVSRRASLSACSTTSAIKLSRPAPPLMNSCTSITTYELRFNR